ncbi:uncharacterized protein LOC112499862 [Cynara cardunculus var. scolymus]|uniref:uncharacterized protein LOC112499862 n=1 Tax=Cynara cardunculus var. scolymus TaxID=59895 RepID=UPI000D6269A1|nr:uncharacterized protein LOC112499862 [Cynara cardunculus var. scolymus]
MSRRRENPEVAQLVSKQLLAAVPNIVSQVAADLNANQPTNSRPRTPRERTYKSFRSCNPKEFHETEGAVGLLTWIEGMESFLHISRCTKANKVEYAACLLQGRALTWWNTLVQTRGREAANQLSWEEFKKLLKDEYCPRSELQKLEMELWNHEMKGKNIDTYTARFHELAKLVPHLVTPKEVRVEIYIWGLSSEIHGNITSANPTTLQEAINIATKLINNAVRSGEFAKGKRKVERHENQRSGGRFAKNRKVVGNFGVQTQVVGQGNKPKCIKSLFDSGADKSFVSLDFKPKIDLKPQKLEVVCVIEFANGQEVRARDVILDYALSLTKKDFTIDLIPIELGSFDIVVSMDWLSKNEAAIGCSKKIIRIPQEGGETLIVQGDKSNRKIKIV